MKSYVNLGTVIYATVKEISEMVFSVLSAPVAV
jgi:hypothetical protein